MNYKLICGVAVLCVVLFLVFAFMRRRSTAPAQEVNEKFDGQMDMQSDEVEKEYVNEEDVEEDTDDEDDMA